MLLVVVISGVDINDGVDEAQHEPLGGPVDHDVDRHIILVQGDLFHIREGCGGTTETEFPPDSGKAGKSHPENKSGVSGRLRSAEDENRGGFGRAKTHRVTLPWRVLLSKTLPKSCLADFCSSGWTKFMRVLPMRSSACSARWLCKTGSRYKKLRSADKSAQSIGGKKSRTENWRH